MSNNRSDKLSEEYEFSNLKWFNLQKIIRHLKLIYYLFQRSFVSYLLSQRKPFKDIKQLYNIDGIFLNDGGMFKEYVYSICHRIHPIKNSSVLVPGCGYGLHLITLSSFKPKMIVACDLYEYKNEWDFLQEVIKKNGVDIIFLKSDISQSTIHRMAPFDWIITDAVLEHVNDLNSFLKECHILMKDDGRFYASFGPIWYGPGGDHIEWGWEGLFNHLLLSENDYNAKLAILPTDKEQDSTEGVFIAKNRLFSYLHAKEYLDILDKCEFLKEFLWVKFSTPAARYFKRYPERETFLQNQGATLFDRYCSGMYMWAKKK